MVLLTKDKFLSSYINSAYAKRFTAKNPGLFPVTASYQLAEVMGCLFSDGHLGKNMVIFSSKNMYEIKDFLRLFKETFNADFNYKIEKVTTSKSAFSIYIFSTHIMKILCLCGCPYGNKTNSIFYYPKWIKDSNEYSRGFISRLFDGDASICLDKYNRVKLKFKQQKAYELIDNGYIFLSDIKKALSNQKITSTNIYKSGQVIRKDSSLSFSLEFEINGTRKNLQSLINYRKNIGFNNKKKQNRLDEYINFLTSPSSSSD